MKVLADECIPCDVLRLLAKLLERRKPPVRTLFLLDWLQEQGIEDDLWTPRVAEDGGWLVISADRGMGKGPNLTKLLPALGVTSVYFARVKQPLSSFDKLRALLYLWPEIEEAYRGPAGTRYVIRRNERGFRLEVWPIKNPMIVLPPDDRRVPLPPIPDAPGQAELPFA